MTGITPSSFMRQNALGFAAQSVSIATNLVFNIALPLLLGAALFGQMEIALGFSYLLAGLFDAGFNNAFMSFVSKKHAERKKREIAGGFKKFLRIKMTFALILSVSMFSSSSFLSSAYGIPALTFQVASILVFFYALLSMTASFFTAIQKNQISLIGNILIAVFLISLPILFFYSGFRVNGVIMAVVISYFISSLALLFLALKEINKFGKPSEPAESFFRRIIGFSSVSMSLVFINWGILLILGLFTNSSEVAFFKVSLSWVLAVIAMIPISASVVFSSFIEFNEEDRKKMMKYAEKAFHYAFIFAVPMMFGLYIVGPKMIQAVYGAEFARAGISLSVLCWAVLPLFANSFFIAIFTAAGKLKKLSSIYVLSTAAGIAVSLILVSEYGLQGAAVSFVFINYLIFISLHLSSKTGIRILSKLTKPVAASLIMSLFALHFINSAHSIPEGIILITASAFVYFAFLWLIKGIGKKDINAVKLLKSD